MFTLCKCEECCKNVELEGRFSGDKASNSNSNIRFTRNSRNRSVKVGIRGKNSATSNYTNSATAALKDETLKEDIENGHETTT